MKISIPTPCSENWNQMLPDEKGKFCLSCQKCVMDFTKMSDEEILEIIQKPNQCGRFSNHQLENLNRKLKKQTQFQFPRIFRYSTLMIGLGLGGTLVAQEKCTPIVSVEHIKLNSDENNVNDSIIFIEGNIYDLDAFPVSQAMVGIKGNKNYRKITNENGYFKIEIPKSIKFDKIFVDSEYGYGEYKVQNETNQNLKITLENYTIIQESMVLGGMVVEGVPIKPYKHSFAGKVFHTIAWPFRQIGKLF